MSSELKSIKDIHNAIENCTKQVFIIGHNEPDYDSIASAIGIQEFCNYLGKDAYIIVNDPDVNLESGVKKIKDVNKISSNIITLKEYEQLKSTDDTLIVVDTNKKNLISVEEYINDFKNIIILDHHNTDHNTIENANYYIDSNISSASEAVSQLLINYRIPCDKNIYSYLLAGIILDTGRFKKNTTSKTHDIAKKLINKGANTEYVNELFLIDFNDDKKINDLVFNGTIFETYEYSLLQNYNVSFTLNREKPKTIYRKDQIAKAADEMLKYRVDAAFVIGHLDEDTVQISARSKGIINVGKIMSQIGGGGNNQNAASKIKETSTENIEAKIRAVIEEDIQDYNKNTLLEEQNTDEIPKQKTKK